MSARSPEFDLIARIRARAASRDDVVLGIGDDAAIVRLPRDRDLVVAMDTLNAGVHFPEDTAPADLGWKALAVNLSDLAAMAATPAWCTLSLSLPAADAAWLDAFMTMELGVAAQRQSSPINIVLDSVAEGCALFIGNSLAIRQLDSLSGHDDKTLHFYANRGASGIDGNISTAAGIAAAHGQTVALIGDLTCQHDLGGLAACRDTRAPLVLVVVQNGGGRIFEQLPVARVEGLGDGLRHFTTPHDLRFDHAAALFGLRYARAQTSAELAAALADAQSSTGVTVIEAIVPPHGAASMMQALQGRIEAALAAEGLA